ncbi:MAG: FKBP-type peptidyl-prolyl cis-trans isomerase [Candidatus Omnitrophica bacterium]|nr:FKBP-type peptidyl-prolyl cis-trans isomerase [Candidatus Omnitrophota bacterium]
MKSLRLILTVFVIFLGTLCPTAVLAKIQDGQTVTMHYTMTMDEVEIDSTRNREPIVFILGDGDMLPGLEEQIKGLKKGSKKKIILPPDKAYGELKTEGFKEFEKSLFPEGTRFLKGLAVQVKSDAGLIIPAFIWDVREETVILNLNHPLAGKTLIFDVEIINIK